MATNDAYISEVFIKNFQSHEETLLELSPGVNALVGDTDCGKSAVFRALIWLFTNKPAGDEFRSHWGGDTEVSACLKNGHSNVWLGRVKGKGKNYYWIEDDLPANRLSGFGAKAPPQPVLDLLKMTDVNFQAQMTLPFLLSMSASQAGKFFNDSADLNVIDQAVSYASGEVRNKKVVLGAAAAQHKQLKEKLTHFDWLDDAEKDVSELEEERKRIDILTYKADDLDGLCESIEQIDETIKQDSPILEAEEELELLAQGLVDIKQTQGYVNNAVEIIRRIDGLDCNIEDLIAFDPADKQIQACLKLVKEINALANEQSLILYHVGLMKDLEKRIEQVSIQHKAAQEAFYKRMPNECPLCGSLQ